MQLYIKSKYICYSKNQSSIIATGNLLSFVEFKLQLFENIEINHSKAALKAVVPK